MNRARSIDGFKPTTTPFERVTLPKVEPESRSFETTGSKVDSRRVNALPKGVVVAKRQDSPRRKFSTPQSKPRWRLPDYIQLPLIIGAGMLGGILAQSAAFGQLAIVIYGVLALVRGIPSRTTFMLALLTMLGTIVLLVFKGDVVLAQNFATYTFLLLVVGVLTLSRELKKEGGRVYSRRNKH